MSTAGTSSARPRWVVPGLDRGVTWLSVAVAAVAMGWALADRSGLASVAPLIAAAGIVAGVPHGAVDHLVPGWASPRWSTSRRLALVLGVYVTAAAAAAAALWSAPEPSFLIFLVVSALHFGWAETAFAAERRGARVPRVRSDWWPAAAHGCVVVALPLWSVEARSVLGPLVPGLVAGVAAVPRPAVVTAVLGAVALAVLGLLVRRRALEAIELAVLLVLFVLVPPLAAFGVYFGVWHALRHTSRLMDQLAPGRPVPVQARAFARAAALPTAAALAVLALLWTYRGGYGVVLAGVSVLLALTFPHVVIVGVLDRCRAVRGRDGGTGPGHGHEGRAGRG